jgi:hypothetical protein
LSIKINIGRSKEKARYLLGLAYVFKKSHIIVINCEKRQKNINFTDKTHSIFAQTPKIFLLLTNYEVLNIMVLITLRINCF